MTDTCDCTCHDRHPPGRVETSLAALAEHIARIKSGQRVIIAMAGPPASGKSKTAEDLAGAIKALGRSAAVVQMDGFHFDDRVLKHMGLLPQKGAPMTFDVAGFAALLERLSENAEDAVYVPVFDRSLELSRGAARAIPKEVEVVIVEGNYLLLQEAAWAKSAALYDVSVMVFAHPKTLEERLLARWADAGLPPEVGRAKAEGNDLPNGRLVLRESRTADFWIDTGNGQPGGRT